MNGLVRIQKRPVIVEAMRIETDTAATGQHRLDPNTESIARISGWMLGHGFGYFRVHAGPPFGLMIKTLEGYMLARAGWWVIRGVKGEFYPCDPEILEMSYIVLEEG